MAKKFQKLMRDQVQEDLNQFISLINKPRPQVGWIKTIREVLGMPSRILAKRLGCSQANIAAIEKRESKCTISLEVLEQVAAALNCKLVYALVPEKTFDQMLTEQARKIAKHQIKIINHSMSLEQQGLTIKQIKQQEDALVLELLQGNVKKLWNHDEI